LTHTRAGDKLSLSEQPAPRKKENYDTRRTDYVARLHVPHDPALERRAQGRAALLPNLLHRITPQARRGRGSGLSPLCAPRPEPWFWPGVSLTYPTSRLAAPHIAARRAPHRGSPRPTSRLAAPHIAARRAQRPPRTTVTWAARTAHTLFVC